MDDIVLLLYIVIYPPALNCLENCLLFYKFVSAMYCV